MTAPAVMTFGRYVGRPLADLPTRYLRWLLVAPGPIVPPDLRAALEGELARREGAKKR